MTLNRRRFLKTTAGTILAAPALVKGALASNHGPITVSYTHLTLPTICSV